MSAEQILIYMGMPYSEVLGTCYALRKEGRLEEFIKEKVEEYRNYMRECAKLAEEAIG